MVSQAKTLIAGEDIEVRVSLTKYDAFLDEYVTHVASGTVRAVITDPSGLNALSSVVTLADTHAESNWANGDVVVEIPEATSANITASGRCSIQVEVDDGTDKTTHIFPGYKLVQSQIS